MSETDSTCSEASLGDTISEVEGCLDKLSRIEQEKFIVFRSPTSDEEERAMIWSKYEIQGKVCTEDLAELLSKLASADRSMSWFTWLRWVLFGVQ